MTLDVKGHSVNFLGYIRKVNIHNTLKLKSCDIVNIYKTLKLKLRDIVNINNSPKLKSREIVNIHTKEFKIKIARHS